MGVMKGYLKNPSATAKEFRDGVFNSGDLAVIHPDGYIQLKDRSKDIIISGGENPVAWVVCRPGESMTDEEIYKWCRENMPRYMVPRTFMFESLAKVKTSTGKVQKHVLRAEAKTLAKPPMTITSADDATQLRAKL